MKNAPNAESENVIQISFGSRQIPHDIAHPASKNFPEAAEESFEDDPLAELLREGSSFDFEEEEEEENYIHAHQKPFARSASFADDSRDLAGCALERLARLKEDAKRLRYYLDELNID